MNMKTTDTHADALVRLAKIKTAARISVGFVWLWEGLVPKMLWPSQIQFEMVRRSGWWIGSPEATLWWLGLAIFLYGILIVSGLWEKCVALVSVLAVLVLMVLVTSTNPDALMDPFGGLAKDACLMVNAALIWFWPQVPSTQASS